MKKTLFKLVLVITALCFGASVAHSEDLYPVADGHYAYSCSGCYDFGDCFFGCSFGIYTDIYLDTWNYETCYGGAPVPCPFDYGDNTGFMEFDISGV